MGKECELLAACGFFKKYQETKNLVCKGFINQYCTGRQMEECKRKKYRKQHGDAPSEDMMPSGKMVSK